MRISDIDPADVQVLADLHELACACFPIDRPHVPPPTLAETTVDWTRGYCGARLAGIQARLDGKLAGYAWLSLPVADNPANADAEIVVDPALRRRGIGSALAAVALDRLRASRRKVAIGPARTDSPGRGFALAIGAKAQQDQLRNILYLDTLDRHGMAGQVRAAATRAAGYDLVRITGPTPAEHRPAVAAMYQVLNDAPQISGSLQDEKWSAARVAVEDQWHAARGDRMYAILARSAKDGQPAGVTRIVVRSAGDLAVQVETAVRSAHRGHRLGYLMKATMPGWLLQAEPQVRRISTFNTATNEHMIAINTELGFIPVERWTFFERAVGPT